MQPVQSASEKTQRIGSPSSTLAVTTDIVTGRVIGCDESVVSITGFSVDEVIGQSVLSLFDSSCQNTAEIALEQLKANRCFCCDNLSMRKKDAGTFTVDVWALTILDQDGCSVYASWMFRLRESDPDTGALLQHEMLLRAILDNSNAVVYAKDTEGRYLFVNKEFLRIFSITTSDVLGKSDRELFCKEQADAFRRNDRQVASDLKPQAFEEDVQHDDGRHTYLSIKFPFFDENGELYAVCGISTDITRRKNAERALRESEELFRQMADNIRECVGIIEVKTGRVLYASPAFELIFGRPLQWVYESPGAWISAVHPADRGRVHKAFDECVQTGGFSEEYRVIWPDGSVCWVWGQAIPIQDDSGDIHRLAGIAQDITQRKTLEKQVADASAHEQQRLSQELHDGVGQTLTGLSLLAETLAHKLTKQAGPQSAVAAELSAGLRESLRDIRRIVTGLGPADIDEHSLRDALRILVENAGQRSDIQCEFECDAWFRVRDKTVATHLFRITQEALNNAVKHSGGNRIVVSLSTEGHTDVLRVHDNGTGINGNEEEHGGMGLHIMQYRSGLIGARLNLQSAPGQGTTVTCSVPRET